MIALERYGQYTPSCVFKSLFIAESLGAQEFAEAE
jgi:hypothetical protein